MRCDVLRHSGQAGPPALARLCGELWTNLRENPIRYLWAAERSAPSIRLFPNAEHGTEEALGTMGGGAQRLDRPEPEEPSFLTIFVGFRGRARCGRRMVINPAHLVPSTYPKRHDR